MTVGDLRRALEKYPSETLVGVIRMDYPHEVAGVELEQVQPYDGHYHIVFEWDGELLPDEDLGPVTAMAVIR